MAAWPDYRPGRLSRLDPRTFADLGDWPCRRLQAAACRHMESVLQLAARRFLEAVLVAATAATGYATIRGQVSAATLGAIVPVLVALSVTVDHLTRGRGQRRRCVPRLGKLSAVQNDVRALQAGRAVAGPARRGDGGLPADHQFHRDRPLHSVPATGDHAGPLLRAAGRGGPPCRPTRLRPPTTSPPSAATAPVGGARAVLAGPRRGPVGGVLDRRSPLAGLVSFLIMAGFGAIFVVGRRSESIRMMAAGRRADERWRSIDLRATAVAGLAVITAVIVGFVWEIATEAVAAPTPRWAPSPGSPTSSPSSGCAGASELLLLAGGCWSSVVRSILVGDRGGRSCGRAGAAHRADSRYAVLVQDSCGHHRGVGVR
jgi:hypothetical protein